MKQRFISFGSMLIGATLLLSACAGPAPMTPVPQVTATSDEATGTAPAGEPATSVPADMPTSVPTETVEVATPSPQPPGIAGRVAVQLPDNMVVWVDATGNVTPLEQAPSPLSSAPYAAAATGETIYGLSFTSPMTAYAIDGAGVRPLSFVGPFITGLAAWPGSDTQGPLLAWASYTTTVTEAGSTATAFLHISTPEGSDARVVVSETDTTMLPNLVPVQWLPDGQSLYYSSEPTGIGGYILFSGLSNLQRYDLGTGMTTTVIARDQLGMLCIDDLSDDASLVAYHCGEKAIGVLDVTSGQTSTIQPPAVLTDAAALGSAQFSPDRSRIAYALARRNPDNEQGWLAVSNNLSGESTVIVTGEPSQFLSVKGWLDADTIVFQRSPITSQATASVWMVETDGSGLTQLSEGTALVVTPAAEPKGGLQEFPGSVMSARQVLGQQLHIPSAQIRVVSQEQVDWPDACLGVQMPGVACAEVITPGYRVILEADGKQYEFHTDIEGGMVLLADAPPVEITDAALEWQQTGDGCQYALLNADTVVFGPCDGPKIPGKFAQEGRANTFAHYVQTYAPFKADTVAGSLIFTGTGSTVATPAEQRMIAEFARLASIEAAGGRSGASYGLAFAWHREGGIAGFCEDLTVYVIGEVYATSCKSGTPQELGRGWLSAEQAEQVFDWTDRFKNFEIDQTDPAQADAMTIRMVFAGEGDAEPTDEDKQAIQDFAQALLNQIARQG